MSYQQLVQPNLMVVGQPEMCLAYVRAVFGASVSYPSATVGWQQAQYKHPGEQPPSGVSVPVWFSYNGPDGHVAVSTPNGVYSTSAVGDKVFSSIQALVNWMGEGMTYLGWSEDVDQLRVVQEEDMPDLIDENASKQLQNTVLARNGLAGRPYSLDGSTGTPWVGTPLTLEFLNDIFTSAEASDWRDADRPDTIHGIQKELDAIPGLQQQVTDLQQQLKAAQSTPASAPPATDSSVQVTETGLWAAFKRFLGL